MSIYRTQGDAIKVISDGWAVNTNSALFVGKEVSSVDHIRYRVPALSFGTYYIQSDSAPNQLFATLVVE
jgi:hypothetical protein